MSNSIKGILIDVKNKSVKYVTLKQEDVLFHIATTIGCDMIQVAGIFGDPSHVVFVDEEYFYNTDKNNTLFFEFTIGKEQIMAGGNGLIVVDSGTDIDHAVITTEEVEKSVAFFDLSEAQSRVMKLPAKKNMFSELEILFLYDHLIKEQDGPNQQQECLKYAKTLNVIRLKISSFAYQYKLKNWLLCQI